MSERDKKEPLGNLFGKRILFCDHEDIISDAKLLTRDLGATIVEDPFPNPFRDKGKDITIHYSPKENIDGIIIFMSINFNAAKFREIIKEMLNAGQKIVVMVPTERLAQGAITLQGLPRLENLAIVNRLDENFLSISLEVLSKLMEQKA